MNQVVIVTGSTKGIGFYIAKEFLNDADKVVVFSRSRDNLDQAVGEFLKVAPKENLLATLGDVSKPEDVSQIIGETLSRFGKIDILVNNAGVGWENRLEQTTIDEVNQTIDINLKGTIFFSRLVIPIMKAQNSGTILNISSGLGVAGAPGFSVYAASKFGVIGLTESLAEELKNDNIRVQAILPGAVETEMSKGMKISGKKMAPSFVARKIYEIASETNLAKINPPIKIDLFY